MSSKLMERLDRKIVPSNISEKKKKLSKAVLTTGASGGAIRRPCDRIPA